MPNAKLGSLAKRKLLKSQVGLIGKKLRQVRIIGKRKLLKSQVGLVGKKLLNVMIIGKRKLLKSQVGVITPSHEYYVQNFVSEILR